jgi:hypothetical protein
MPRAVTWGGVPEYVDGEETGRTLITQDGLAELGGYLLAVRQWMAAASGCLEVRP